jgi:hypothetical protein
LTAGHASIRLDDEFVAGLAARLADHVADRLGEQAADGYLDADAAGRYLGVPRKRIYDLTSSGALVPDGHDGRKPLYRKSRLDAYAQGAG